MHCTNIGTLLDSLYINSFKVHGTAFVFSPQAIVIKVVCHAYFVYAVCIISYQQLTGLKAEIAEECDIILTEENGEDPLH